MNIGRHEHHRLASLIASREVSDTEASALTGYSPHTISNLRHQRPFQALVDYYAEHRGPPAIPDAGDRMHTLGITVLEELQSRLADNPETFTKRELFDMADLLLIKAKGLGSRAAAVEPVRLAISFVPAEPVNEMPQLLDDVSYSRAEDA